MNRDWVFHDSHSLLYRSPFGAVSCNQKVTLNLKVQSREPVSNVWLRLWTNSRGEETIPMQWSGQGASSLYRSEITAPGEPGPMWYYFIVQQYGKTHFYGNNQERWGGVGDSSDTPPPPYQISVYETDMTTPHWFKESVMYQIFVDRFYNGQEDGKILNPRPGSLLHASWNDVPVYVQDRDTGEILSFDFFGGNLAGIIAKLPYLKKLGINVLYLNPVFEAPSNHKYDTGNYLRIDPMFGDSETFRLLCEKAREAGIAVILDGVFSHTGSDSIYFNKYGTYDSLGAYQSQKSPYHKWYRFEQFPHRYESWWGIDTLPNVEEMEPSYRDFIIHNQDSVLKTWLKLGAKGWRLDVVDELPDEFVKEFYKVLKESDPEAVLIGEVWEDASHKTSYGVLREYLWGRELDSVMNYPFRMILLNFMWGNKDARDTNRALMSLYENYPLQHFYALMNLIGSHDVPRVLTLLGDAPLENTLTKGQQRRYRLSPEQKDRAVKRLKLLALWQMTFPGIPCIYYGDEAGLEGYSDPYNRGPYPWGRENQELLAWYKQIIALRNQYDVFKTGQWLPLLAEGDVYVYLRLIDNGRDVFGRAKENNTAIVLLNRNAVEARTVTVDIGAWCGETLYDALNGQREVIAEDGKLTVTLAPATGMVLLQEINKPREPGESGILLHPTSLPSAHGIGDFGPEAYRFVDFLAAAEQKLWQILPLNPVGFGESPYQCLSAFAGNPLLISPDRLIEEGLLSEKAVQDAQPHQFPDENVDFDLVKPYKENLFLQAYEVFYDRERPAAYTAFVTENKYWLADYALFMALREHFEFRPWNEWPEAIRLRRQDAMDYYRDLLADEVEYHYFLQYEFFRQWQELKAYANRRGIHIIGDLPIFVAHDSSDVWSNQHLFELDPCGNPVKVAGVPPDYFSETGQLWGNPHYKWNEMARDDYHWWRDRFRALLQMVDRIRIDHFRGFEAYWEIPAGERTAVNGRWVEGPGAQFFLTMEKHLGKMPVIAEDLGIITPGVRDLKNQFGFPGMKVLHFALPGGAKSQYLPRYYQRNVVVYTGTHDNDTTLGWYRKGMLADPDNMRRINECLGISPAMNDAEINWRFIAFAFSSRAAQVVIPLQDILSLDTEARMNFPGTVGSNWRWRFAAKALPRELAAKLAELTKQYQR
ncbi:glycosyl hydrolase all-beta [Lucifera butyrica]|uniref:4-alpha-glucanotransferase n=1 Tax=Lucifera butyrica TaxID=1351585 RepID=A0A498R7D1_9FIRM|nr:bifunctional glycogen debranching protein GlgX/4-alpha-glucanotransferase [Lucifera butyrica]VBB05038.1 glycosyl hydrolase all-beta [Lucifera butyrica]